MKIILLAVFVVACGCSPRQPAPSPSQDAPAVIAALEDIARTEVIRGPPTF